MKTSTKVIVITGGSDGIGAEMARQLAKLHGSQASLVLAARNTKLLNEVANDCQAHGARTLVLKTDVSNQGECRDLIASAIREFGKIDVLINNAGRTGHAMFEDVRDLSWYEDMMRVNFWGSVWCTHAALPYLKASQGNIVAVSSLAGLIGVPGRTAYNASKFAMTGFFESLRTELKAVNVSVTTAYPNVVATQMRDRGFNAALGNSSGGNLNKSNAMSVEACAGLIISAMDKRRREVVMTPKAKMGRFLKLIFPGLVDNMVLAALKK